MTINSRIIFMSQNLFFPLSEFLVTNSHDILTSVSMHLKMDFSLRIENFMMSSHTCTLGFLSELPFNPDVFIYLSPKCEKSKITSDDIYLESNQYPPAEGFSCVS